jgi:putative polymerase
MMPTAAHPADYSHHVTSTRDRDGLLPICLVLAAALFNAGLAIINAKIKPLSSNIVILSEVLIVASAHAYILRNFQTRMVNWYFLALAFAVFAVLRITATGNVDAKYFRDIFVIVTFVLLGMTSNERRVIQMMTALQVAVMAGIVFEAACVECYGDLFAVKDFYVNTRGVSESDFTNLASDLYVSATRPEARFLPFFDLHRLSSIFLEPVSLGNFMIMTVAFTAAYWRRMQSWLQLFLLFSITLMLFACDGRLAMVATTAILAMSLGKGILPRHVGLVFLPVIAVLAIFVTDSAGLRSGTDDLPGRIAYTAELLTSMQFLDFAGLSDRLLEQSVDAGAVYLMITQSFLGVALLWAFVTLAADEMTPEQKIYKNGLLLYLALTMMVSYSFASIKTAAPIWFIFGSLLSPAAFRSNAPFDDGEAEIS